MANKIKMEVKLPVPPKVVYDAWLEGSKHAEMTNNPASCEPKVGYKFSAWDKYISGKNVELIPNKKIVQLWRTTDFKESDKDSLLEINIEPTEKGCKLKLIHSEIPDDQPDYAEGWKEFYFVPMKEYFSK